MVMIGSVATLEAVWTMADITMALMTLVNMTAILLLGKYAVKCLHDYRKQKRRGLDPQYHRDTIPEIASETDSWP